MDLDIKELRTKTIFSEIILKMEDLDIDVFTIETKNEDYCFSADKDNNWTLNVFDRDKQKNVAHLKL